MIKPFFCAICMFVTPFCLLADPARETRRDGNEILHLETRLSDGTTFLPYEQVYTVLRHLFDGQIQDTGLSLNDHLHVFNSAFQGGIFGEVKTKYPVKDLLRAHLGVDRIAESLQRHRSILNSHLDDFLLSLTLHLRLAVLGATLESRILKTKAVADFRLIVHKTQKLMWAETERLQLLTDIVMANSHDPQTLDAFTRFVSDLSPRENLPLTTTAMVKPGPPPRRLVAAINGSAITLGALAGYLAYRFQETSQAMPEEHLEAVVISLVMGTVFFWVTAVAVGRIAIRHHLHRHRPPMPHTDSLDESSILVVQQTCLQALASAQRN